MSERYLDIDERYSGANKSYSANFDQRNLDIALADPALPILFEPYHGVLIGDRIGEQQESSLEHDIERIMEEHDQAWRDLAHL